MHKIGEKNIRGQLTIFIIVGILIVATIVIIFSISPRLRTSVGLGKVETPDNYFKTCMEDSLTENANLIASQGGSMNPKSYYLYENTKLQYLCYTNQLYQTCYVQVPFISSEIEKELKDNLKQNVDSCFDSMEDYYITNYDSVKIKRGNLSISLLPGKIMGLSVNSSVILSKAGSVEEYKNIKFSVDNNLYELTRIASSILDWETTYGDADPIAYMSLYPDLKVEKHLEEDGTAVYIITERSTGNKFQFASRSLLTSPAQL